MFGKVSFLKEKLVPIFGGPNCILFSFLLFILGQYQFALSDDSIPAGSDSSSTAAALNDIPPSPVDRGDAEKAKPATTENLSLDALLELADKDPRSLQAVNVQPSRNDPLSKPEQIFKPDTSAGTAANSTGELISQSFGVVTRSTSAINQDARLRGFSGSEIVGIANGMIQGKSRIDVDSLFSQIDPNLLESITVIPGPYSVEYGPGFAFFDARLIGPTRSDYLTSSSDTKFGFNSNGQQLNWRETARFSDRNAGAIVSFGQRIGNDYRPGSRSTDFNIPASYHEQDIYAAINTDVTERSRLDASYLHQQIFSTELPGIAYDINNQNADQYHVRWTWRDDVTDRDRFQMNCWWNEVTYQGDASRASKQQTFFSSFLGEPYPQLAGGGTVIANGVSNNAGARANLLWGDSETWQIKSGVDWRRVGQLHHEMFIQPDGLNALGNGVLGIPGSSANDYGVFATGGAKITEEWRFSVGQRFDTMIYGLNTNDSAASSFQFTPNNQSVTGFSTPTRALNTTFLMTSYRLSEDVTLNAGAAYAMRPPNLAELYSNSPSAPLVRFGNSFAYGDSNLAAEKNLQFDLGLTKRIEKSTFGVRAFHSEIHDYIGLGATNWGYFPMTGTVNDGTLGRGQPYMANPTVPNPNLTADTASLGYLYRNIDRVTMQGIEFQGEQRVLPWLEFLETLNFTRATNFDPTWTDITTGQVNHLNTTEGLPGIYPLNGSATVRIVEPASRKWTAEWQSRFARQQDYLARSLGEIGTPGFIVNNIHASYRWSEYIALRTSLLNILNLNYYEHTSMAIIDKNGNVTFVKNPGISLFMGVECTF